MKPACLPAVLLLPACIYGNRDLVLGPVAPASDAQLSSRQAITLHVTDARDPSEQYVVGHTRDDGVGMQAADVVADRDPTSWLEQCLTEELQRAGFDVVAAAPLAANVELRVCTAQAGDAYSAEVTADVALARGGRELLAKTSIEGKVKGGVNVAATAPSFQDVLHAAMGRFLAQAVPRIVEAVESAPQQ